MSACIEVYCNNSGCGKTLSTEALGVYDDRVIGLTIDLLLDSSGWVLSHDSSTFCSDECEAER